MFPVDDVIMYMCKDIVLLKSIFFAVKNCYFKVLITWEKYVYTHTLNEFWASEVTQGVGA